MDTVADGNQVTLEVDVLKENNLWVARQADFGLVAAHPSMNDVLFRIFRMIYSQLVFALNHDGELSELTSDPDDALSAQIRRLRSLGRPFQVLMRARKVNAEFSMEVPELTTTR
jgi:hypothetical protein